VRETEVPIRSARGDRVFERTLASPRCLTAEKLTLILAASPGVGSSSN
jgi:hypothetical protein